MNLEDLVIIDPNKSIRKSAIILGAYVFLFILGCIFVFKQMSTSADNDFWTNVYMAVVFTSIPTLPAILKFLFKPVPNRSGVVRVVDADTYYDNTFFLGIIKIILAIVILGTVGVIITVLNIGLNIFIIIKAIKMNKSSEKTE